MINESESTKKDSHCHIVASCKNGITFAVDDVKPATSPLWTGSLDQCVELQAGVSVIEMPDRSAAALAPEGYSQKWDTKTLEPYRGSLLGVKMMDPLAQVKRALKRHTFLHPLVHAVHLAFSDHRPLVLSPDAIWMTIVQGFAQHVLQNAEQLRGRLVMHDDQKKLVVKVLGVQIPWPSVIGQFSSQIRDHSDPILHETLLCDFSTTTPGIKTAYEVALMDAYQRYFKYVIQCICGIPEITLEGTPNDWRRMRERIEVLVTYELGWWTSRLAPILEQFEATADGSPDHAFWQSIYKPQQAYAAEFATGWITDLFPYLYKSGMDINSLGPGELEHLLSGARNAVQREKVMTMLNGDWYRNTVLDVPRVNWLPASAEVTRRRYSPGYHPVGVSLDSFPSGLSRAPVKIEFQDGSSNDIELMSGFLGVSQREQDNALSPIISWAAVKVDEMEESPEVNLGSL
jgi:Domain of unknown function (DUF4419)